jgi:hypothetical protein
MTQMWGYIDLQERLLFSGEERQLQWRDGMLKTMRWWSRTWRG